MYTYNKLFTVSSASSFIFCFFTAGCSESDAMFVVWIAYGETYSVVSRLTLA